MKQATTNYYDEQTDTHLAKRYNDILSDCLAGCNQAGTALDASPHLQNLHIFYGTVHTLYKNCFMLFYEQQSKGEIYKNLSSELISRMQRVEKGIRLMRRESRFRNSMLFEFIKAECDIIHMLIMDGLQRRKMLVRMSEREPTGEDTVRLWDNQTAFKKGGKIGI